MTPKSLQEQLSSILSEGSLQTRKMKILKPAKPVAATAPSVVVESPVADQVVVAPEGQPSAITVKAESRTEDVKACAMQQAARVRKSFASLAKLDVTAADGLEKIQLVERRSRVLASQLKTMCKGRREDDAREAVAASTWLVNVAQSLREASSSHDLTSADLLGAKRTALAKLDDLNSFLQQDGHQQVEAVMLEDLPAAYFNKYRKYASRLPNTMTMTKEKLRFKVMKAPVIAIFSRPVQAADLAADGFDVSDDGGYIVFNDQSIWCINQPMLNDSETWSGDEGEYLERLKTQYKKRTGSPAVLMGMEGKMRVVHRNSKGIGFYWAMPQREQRGLNAALNGATLKEWGFTF